MAHLLSGAQKRPRSNPPHPEKSTRLSRADKIYALLQIRYIQCLFHSPHLHHNPQNWYTYTIILLPSDEKGFSIEIVGPFSLLMKRHPVLESRSIRWLRKPKLPQMQETPRNRRAPKLLKERQGPAKTASNTDFGPKNRSYAPLRTKPSGSITCKPTLTMLNRLGTSSSSSPRRQRCAFGSRRGSRS